MKKEIRYPILIILFFGFIGAMIVLSLQKIGPDMNPAREAIEIDSLQTSYISVRFDKKWLFSEQICSPGLILRDCLAFQWNNFSDYKLPEGKNSLSLFIAEDMSKERAVDLFSRLKKLPITSLFLSSPIDSSISNAKKADPSPLYSTSLTQLIKWNLFATLGLSTVYNIQADFIVVDKKVETLLKDEIIKEIKRRKIPLIYTYSLDRELFDHEYILVN